jgi:hypothetical protein
MKAQKEICLNCGKPVQFDGIVEDHVMYIDSDGFRTCEDLGGGTETPAHTITP